MDNRKPVEIGFYSTHSDGSIVFDRSKVRVLDPVKVLPENTLGRFDSGEVIDVNIDLSDGLAEAKQQYMEYNIKAEDQCFQSTLELCLHILSKHMSDGKSPVKSYSLPKSLSTILDADIVCSRRTLLELVYRAYNSYTAKSFRVILFDGVFFIKDDDPEDLSKINNWFNGRMSGPKSDSGAAWLSWYNGLKFKHLLSRPRGTSDGGDKLAMNDRFSTVSALTALIPIGFYDVQNIWGSKYHDATVTKMLRRTIGKGTKILMLTRQDAVDPKTKSYVQMKLTALKNNNPDFQPHSALRLWLQMKLGGTTTAICGFHYKGIVTHVRRYSIADIKRIAECDTNPINHPEAALERMETCISQMMKTFPDTNRDCPVAYRFTTETGNDCAWERIRPEEWCLPDSFVTGVRKIIDS